MKKKEVTEMEDPSDIFPFNSIQLISERLKMMLELIELSSDLSGICFNVLFQFIGLLD